MSLMGTNSLVARTLSTNSKTQKDILQNVKKSQHTNIASNGSRVDVFRFHVFDDLRATCTPANLEAQLLFSLNVYYMKAITQWHPELETHLLLNTITRTANWSIMRTLESALLDLKSFSWQLETENKPHFLILKCLKRWRSQLCRFFASHAKVCKFKHR